MKNGYAIIELSLISNILSTFSGDSSGSISNTCFVISARLGSGNSIVISLYCHEANATVYQVEGKDILNKQQNNDNKCRKYYKHILWLNHLFISVLLHLFHLNSVLIILIYLLHRLFKSSLFVALSAWLHDKLLKSTIHSRTWRRW